MQLEGNRHKLLLGAHLALRSGSFGSFPATPVPDDYVVVTISIPETVSVKRGSSFEAKNARPQHPVWIVPSVIIGREMNIILYPEASGFSSRITDIEDFQFDHRLVAPIPRN